MRWANAMQEDLFVDETSLPQISEPLISEPLRDLPNSADDIPLAVRETPVVSPQPRLKPMPLLWGLLGAGAIALSIGLFVGLRPQSAASSAASKADANPSGSPSAQPAASPAEPTALLGHLPYNEAPKSELAPITSGGDILMRKAAAEKFMEMQSAARSAGVELVPISGFRSVQDQEHVFFDVKAQRGQDTTTRSEVSAPPGYSEHHTGYAVDIGDGNHPDLNLQEDFESSPAYQWLKENAGFYSFEISFPKNNPMNVSYEPWHWRFVGDRNSLETFYRARTTMPPKAK
ncbi:MAG TPA: M15 family metallopeptidase [Coleofasciculaceae cyanobacterium]